MELLTGFSLISAVEIIYFTVKDNLEDDSSKIINIMIKYFSYKLRRLWNFFSQQGLLLRRELFAHQDVQCQPSPSPPAERPEPS